MGQYDVRFMCGRSEGQSPVGGTHSSYGKRVQIPVSRQKLRKTSITGGTKSLSRDGWTAVPFPPLNGRIREKETKPYIAPNGCFPPLATAGQTTHPAQSRRSFISDGFPEASVHARRGENRGRAAGSGPHPHPWAEHGGCVEHAADASVWRQDHRIP
jgi:hypothetical protein